MGLRDLLHHCHRVAQEPWQPKPRLARPPSERLRGLLEKHQLGAMSLLREKLPKPHQSHPLDHRVGHQFDE